MPVLSRFYGIIIRMYFLQSEHNPPHIHAIYNEDVAAIDFMTGEVWKDIFHPRHWQWSKNGFLSIKNHCRKCGKRKNSKNFHRWNKEECLCFIR